MATIHLQGIGRVPAEPASALEVGDRIMWNYGSVYTVVTVEDASAHFIRITERDKAGKVWGPRRLKKTRLVARMRKAPAETPREHAARELAAEFGTDVSEWLV